MANGDDAQHFLVAQIEKARAGLAAAPCDTVCASHEPLCFAVDVILQCESGRQTRYLGETLLIDSEGRESKRTIKDWMIKTGMVASAMLLGGILLTVLPPALRQIAQLIMNKL